MSRKMIQSRFRPLGFLLVLFTISFAAWAFSTPADDWKISGPFGGTARSIAIDPQRPDVLLAGGMNSLVFRSHDAGENWELLNFPKRNLSEVTSLLVDPTDSNHYFAGMISAEDGGLFESHDEGRSWSSVKAISKFGVRALASAPSLPTQLLAGTLQGVWMSENSGKDWKRISEPDNLEMQGITVVTVDSKDPKTIYAGTSHLPWKTTDGGKTWQSIHTGMIDDSDVFSIFVDPANPNEILASACSGIYASATRGEQWKKLLGIPNTSRRTHVIREDPSGPDIIYAGTTTGLFKSSNRGQTWKTLSDTQANHIVFDPSKPGRMYLAMEYEGIGKSENGGEGIQMINRGFVDRSISAVTRAGDKLVAIETQEGDTSGIFTSNDRGENWARLKDVHGLGGVHLKAITGLPVKSGILIAATPHRMFKSMDGGNLWKPLPVRVIEPPPPTPARPPAATVRRGGKAVASRARASRKPVPKIREVSLNEISALYSTKNGSQELVFVASDLGLLRSTDAGEHWTVTKLNAAPSVSALFQAADESGYMVARSSVGLFVSKDFGENWNELRFPLPASDVNEVAIPNSQSQSLLAATRVGLYSSTDGGATWYANLGGIPASTVTSVVFTSQEGTAYAVEYGRLFQTSNSGAGWKEVPTQLPSLRIRRLWLPDLASGRLYGITSDLGIIFRDGTQIR